MRIENSGTLGVASGSKFTLQEPVEFDDYQECARIRIEVQVPIRNPTGGTLAIAKADYLALYEAIFASFTLKFGGETVDDSMVFDRAREMHMGMCQRDMPFVSYGGTVGQLADFTTENIATVTNGTVKLEYHRTFVFERLGVRLASWCPGASQMRALHLSFQRGSAWSTSGGVVENGAASVLVIFDAAPAKTGAKDVWARPPRLFTSETGGLTGKGPDGGGAVLMAWHYNAAAGTTGGGLGNFSLTHDKEHVHDDIDATRLTRDEFMRLPLGAKDLNTLATVLLSPSDAVAFEDLWVGGVWAWRQVNKDLDPPKLAWLYVPPTDGDYRDGVLQDALISETRPEVKVTVLPSFQGQRIPLTHTSIAPLIVLDPDHPAYAQTAGRRFRRGMPPETYVPPATIAAVKDRADKAGAAGGDEFARGVGAIAALVPGGASIKQGSLTDTAAAVGAYIDPAQAKTLSGKFTNLH